MITATLQGGVGNQMFQLAAAIGHAERMGTTYNIEFPYALHYVGPFHNAQKNGTLPNYREPNFQYTPIDEKHSLNLFGYFQSSKYFDHVKAKIKQKFTPVGMIRDYCERKYKHICEGATAIHVRRGDYLELKDYHYNLDYTYYQKAVEKVGSDKCVVFSDDIEYCRSAFSPEFTFIHEDEVKDLYIMSMCENFIIANSSYSWWAAYLGEKGGVTVAPKTWFGPKKADLDTSDLYEPNWIVI